jgi:hypothetical protein
MSIIERRRMLAIGLYGAMTINLRKPALYLSDVVREPCTLITGTSQ